MNLHPLRSFVKCPGGRFLMTPLLNILFNVPYNVAVESEISQMLGTSFMNRAKFRMLMEWIINSGSASI